MRLYLRAVEVQVRLAAGVVGSLHTPQVDHMHPLAEAVGNLLVRTRSMLERTDQKVPAFVLGR